MLMEVLVSGPIRGPLEGRTIFSSRFLSLLVESTSMVTKELTI